MRVPVLLLLVVLAVRSVCAAEADDDPAEDMEGVLELTPNNYDEIMHGKKHVFLEFYAPWCGHCKKMAGEMKTLGMLVQTDQNIARRVLIAKCNADAHKEIAEKFDVKGYPMVRWFSRGQPPSLQNAVEYKDPRTATYLFNFVKSRLDDDKTHVELKELKPLLSRWYHGGQREEVVREMIAAASVLREERRRQADLFVAIMNKVAEKGESYLDKEKSRLEKLLASRSVSKEKETEMIRKLDVIEILQKGPDA